MQRKIVLETAVIAGFLLAATYIIALTGLDIKVSSTFFVSGAWPMTNLFPWRQLYLLDRTPAIVLALSGLVLGVCSYKKPVFAHWRKAGVFLALFLIIGPGLVVNTGFKDGWGRPRPREIVQFGGKKEFRQPWQKGVRGDGRSFPSGHGSAAFFMMAPFFIYRRQNPRRAFYWISGGLIFGILMSTARIVQGAHFLSDNLWAFGIVYLTGLWLAAFMKVDEFHEMPDITK